MASSYFMVPDDEYSLQRMLGIQGEMPAFIQEEYQMRIRFYHKDGNSGPMGSLALLDMLRFLGCSPNTDVKENGPIDWRQQEIGCPVEARRAGEWTPGVYAGPVGSGTLAVKFINGYGPDREPSFTVGEFMRGEVRLPKSPLPSDVHKGSFENPHAAEDKPDARAALLNANPTTVASPETIQELSQDAEPERDDQDGEPIESLSEAEYDSIWANVARESIVTVQDGDTLRDAAFMRYDRAKKLVIVRLNGEKKHTSFDRELVFCAAEFEATQAIGVL